MNNLDFLLPEYEREKEGVALLDFSQIALATALNNFEDKDKITISMMRHLVLTSIKKNVTTFRKQGYTKFIICIDNAKSGYWRRDYAYYYKKNRGKAREESKWDWEGYFNASHQVTEELIKYMPYITMNIDKIEADDHIAVLTKKLSLEGHPVLIISSDGDFTQLHKYPNVKQWSPMQKKWVKIKSGSAEIDCMTKILKGDKKDNVAAVKVRSDFWFTKIDGERTPSIKTALVEEIANDREKAQTLLTEAEYKRYQENLVLIDFDYIPEEIASSILDYYESYKVPPRGKIYSYFVKSGLSKLTNHMNEF